MNDTISKIDKVKNVIRNNYIDASCGLFFDRNWVGDSMHTIWEEDGVTIDICYEYEYFEVFGLTEEEENELLAFYNSITETDKTQTDCEHVCVQTEIGCEKTNCIWR